MEPLLWYSLKNTIEIFNIDFTEQSTCYEQSKCGGSSTI